ncbi:hypothetical protein BH10ACT1_BH10ACT1_25100 [soil metagenome]
MSPAADAAPLARYAAGARPLDRELARLVADAGALAAGSAERVRSPFRDIHAGLERLAGMEAATTRWVGAVGLALAAVDADVVGSGATTVELLVQLAASPLDPYQAAAAVREATAAGRPGLVAAVAVARGSQGIAGCCARPDDLAR